VALGFGGGGAGALGIKALGARGLRVAMKITIANIIVQTTSATVRYVIHTSIPSIVLGSGSPTTAMSTGSVAGLYCGLSSVTVIDAAAETPLQPVGTVNVVSL